MYKFVYDIFSNLQSVKVGSTPLITNTYEDNNGNLTQSTYGNNDYVKYTYDTLDRVKAVNYNGVEKFSFIYDYSNRLARVTNEAENYTTDYTYDLSGRLIEKSRSDGAYVKTSYNEKNLATGVSYKFNDLKESATYTYDITKDNAPSKTVITDGSMFISEYDGLGRTDGVLVFTGRNTPVFGTYYEYKDKSDTQTSGLVSKIEYDYANINDIDYTYDALGNIKLITYNNGLEYERFSYDGLNRLVRVDSEVTGETVVYTYDNSGNIKKKDVYYCGVYSSDLSSKVKKYTVNYTYGNSSWGDLLTAYNGTAITYDAIGNPLTYGDSSFTWNGRRMATFSNGTTKTSYKYNEDGVRTSKTVGDTTTYFFVDGTTILGQKTGNVVNSFYYDANGKRIAFRHGGLIYYYVYNLQGDVTHILNESGNIVGTYEYDAWGNITYINGTIAQINPFRYRGYYYDTESGLYYLNSRYYNPEWGRFINADSGIYAVGGSVNGYNLFVYCDNNPINNIDPYGNCPYNGTAADFHRLEQGLPSLDCTCKQYQYNKYEIITFSKKTTLRPDTGLKDLSDDEIQKRARDKSLSGQERRRYQTEEKQRKLRNKQKRLSNIALEPVCNTIVGVAVVGGSAIGITYLVLNNASIAGVLDDVAIPGLVLAFEQGLKLITA